MLLASSPPAYPQAAAASVDFTIRDNVLTLSVESPTPVLRFQVSVNTTRGYEITTGRATLTGFMAGANVLSLVGSGQFNEYRWFSLNSPGGRTGALTIPISPLAPTVIVTLVKLSLQDSAGNTIPLQITLPKGPLQIISTLTTTTRTETLATTITVTREAVTTRTVTVTPPPTTLTLTTTTTLPAVTSTVTTTRTTATTVTTEVSGPLTASPLFPVAIVLVLVILGLAVMLIRRR